MHTPNPLTDSYSDQTPSPFDHTSHNQPQHLPPPKSGLNLGWLAAIGLLLYKAKSLLVLAKFGKFGSTFITMLLSIGVYAMLWGWKFAAGFVLLIFVHELGHVFAAKIKKLPVTAPMFIPFLGASITMKQHPQDAQTEAFIAYGGPLLGTIGALATWWLYYLTGNPLFLALASTALMLNLFNLAPVSPLDGGRICAALSPALWAVGLVILIAWFFVTYSPIMLLIIIIGGIHLFSEWKNRHSDYYKVPPAQRVMWAALYISLAAFLGWSQHFTHLELESLLKPARQQV